jgi:hypothetical protein
MAESGNILSIFQGLYSTKYHGLTAIDYSHNELHEGNLFAVCYSTSVLGASSYYHIQINANSTRKEVHFKPASINNSGGIVRVRVIEMTTASTMTASTVATIPINQNRNSTNIAETGVLIGPTNIGTSSVICDFYCGSTGSVMQRGMEHAEFDDEIILKLNTTYVLRVDNLGTDGLSSIVIKWYENGV